MVRLFAHEGAKVMIHGRRKDAAQKLASEIGKNSAFVIGALEDPQVPAKLIAETVAHFGRIDGLVNNAAIMARGGLENTDVEAFDRTVAVDLKAVPRQNQIRVALERFLTVKAIEGSPLQSELGRD